MPLNLSLVKLGVFNFFYAIDPLVGVSELGSCYIFYKMAHNDIFIALKLLK